MKSVKGGPLLGQEILRELSEFRRKLESGAAMLPALDSLEVGTTPKSVIAQIDKATLYRFDRDTPPRVRTPLLIIYALVNRHYVTDLEPRRSMIRRLLGAGLDVYLIDWGYPDRADGALTLDDYLNRYVDRFVDGIRSAHGIGSLNILGICQGGTLGLCYAALNAAKVRALVTMVTPVDFHTPDNLLSKWVRDIDIDLMVDTLGNIPGEFLNWIFVSLKPAGHAGGKLFDIVDSLEDQDRVRTFFRMEKWINDSPVQAGEAFREFVKAFFQENRLVSGDLQIAGRPVRLADVTMPVLNVYASRDHIVPPAASRALRVHVGCPDYSEFAFEGGHIGIYVSGKAQDIVAPHIARWLEQRSDA